MRAVNLGKYQRWMVFLVYGNLYRLTDWLTREEDVLENSLNQRIQEAMAGRYAKIETPPLSSSSPFWWLLIEWLDWLNYPCFYRFLWRGFKDERLTSCIASCCSRTVHVQVEIIWTLVHKKWINKMWSEDQFLEALCGGPRRSDAVFFFSNVFIETKVIPWKGVKDTLILCRRKYDWYVWKGLILGGACLWVQRLPCVD